MQRLHARLIAVLIIAVFPIAAGLAAALGCAALAAQGAAPVQGDSVSGIAFSYQLPPDWTAITAKPRKPAVTPSLPLLPPKGAACIQVPATARRGSPASVPASVIVVVALPFGCYGQVMTGADLAEFGSGAADGLKQVFDLTDPVAATYSLGSHPFWIERAKGNPKGHAEVQYTVEIACGTLKKGAVCWMAMAADAASLLDFEQMPVELDGETATPLVPAAAFDKGPPA